MTDSNAAVRLDVSSPEMYARCVLSFAHTRALTVSYLFSVKKMRLSFALFFSRFAISSILIS
jgi:hypothetical protein